VEQCGLRKCEEIFLTKWDNVVVWGMVGKFGCDLWGKMPKRPSSNLTEGTVGEYI
jgi:hypothetical protein